MVILKCNGTYRLTSQKTSWWDASSVFRVEKWRKLWRFHWWDYVEEFYSEFGDDSARRRAVEYYMKLCRKDGLSCEDE